MENGTKIMEKYGKNSLNYDNSGKEAKNGFIKKARNLMLGGIIGISSLLPNFSYGSQEVGIKHNTQTRMGGIEYMLNNPEIMARVNAGYRGNSFGLLNGMGYWNINENFGAGAGLDLDKTDYAGIKQDKLGLNVNSHAQIQKEDRGARANLRYSQSDSKSERTLDPNTAALTGFPVLATESKTRTAGASLQGRLKDYTATASASNTKIDVNLEPASMGTIPTTYVDVQSLILGKSFRNGFVRNLTGGMIGIQQYGAQNSRDMQYLLINVNKPTEKTALVLNGGYMTNDNTKSLGLTFIGSPESEEVKKAVEEKVRGVTADSTTGNRVVDPEKDAEIRSRKMPLVYTLNIGGSKGNENYGLNFAAGAILANIANALPTLKVEAYVDISGSNTGNYENRLMGLRLEPQLPKGIRSVMDFFNRRTTGNRPESGVEFELRKSF